MINGSKVRLRNKKLADALNDYSWQNDAELAHLDATTPLNMSFPQYLMAYANDLRHFPALRQRFAIETLDGKHIGNCLYYNTDEIKGEAELGIMLGNRNYWDKGYGTDALTTLINHVFCKTDLKRIYLKTLKSNTRAHHCFQKCGFSPYGHLSRDGHDFLLMEIHRKEWGKLQMKEKGTGFALILSRQGDQRSA